MLRRLVALGAVVGSLFAGAQAQGVAPVSAQAAPAAWVQYARLVEQQFADRLGGDSAPAQRLRTFLQSGTHPVTDIPVRAWVDPQGRVSRIGFTPFLDGQANSDLTGLLQGMKLPQSPPRDILLPIHLRLQIALPVEKAQASAPPARH